MKLKYESPKMFAETFVSNQYIAACNQPMYETTPTQVKCETPGHANTQYITMFTDQQTACDAIFVPHVGSASGDKFKTQFEACAYVDGCNRRKWMEENPKDTNLWKHATTHNSGWSPGKFVNHDTTIDLSLAQKFNLS